MNDDPSRGSAGASAFLGRHKPRLIALALVAIALVGLAAWFLPSPPPFSGDGMIGDTGFWTYPRYTIAFKPIDLTRDGSATYSFIGAPDELWTFHMTITDPQRGRWLARNRSVDDVFHMSVSIARSDGHEVASYSSPLRYWMISETRNWVELWSPSLRELRLDPFVSHQVRIEIKARDQPASEIFGVPSLSGGGNELP